MWGFLFWNMKLEEILRLHLLHYEAQSSLCWGPVFGCSVICLWLPARVTFVNYFYGKVISKSLWKYFPLFCSRAVVFVLLMTQHLPTLMPWLWCVSMRRMSCLKFTQYFLLFSLSIKFFKIPFFCQFQRRSFHYESWGVPWSVSLLIKPCARRKVPFRKQQVLNPGHAHIPAEPWNFPRQLFHCLTNSSVWAFPHFPSTSLCQDLFGLSWLTTETENHFFISIYISNGQKVTLCFKWNITFDT